MSVFRVDTTLYHPIEGARVFPAGESDPGGAWRREPFQPGEGVTLTAVDENGAAHTVRLVRPELETDERAGLIAELQAKDVEYDGRWGAKRLRAALDRAA